MTIPRKYTTLLAIVAMASQVALCAMTVASGEEIPLHWDVRGDADDYGSANQVWWLPLLSFLLFLLLGFFVRHPEYCHWPRRFTDERKGLRLLSALVGCLRLVATLFLTFVVYEVYRDAGFHYRVASLFLVALVATVAVYAWRLSKA